NLAEVLGPYPHLADRLVERLVSGDTPGSLTTERSACGAVPVSIGAEPVGAVAGGALRPRDDSPASPEPDLGPTQTYAARSRASSDATDEPGANPTWVPEVIVPPQDRPHPTGRIGRYRVDRVLGSGAFGTVYLAHDDELQRQVAIKVPRPERIVREEDIEA